VPEMLSIQIVMGDLFWRLGD